MNHRKHKQKENCNKIKKEKYVSYVNDPEDAKCPHCGLFRKPCSHINGLSRAYARYACKERLENLYNK
jgi:hypothetical protein